MVKKTNKNKETKKKADKKKEKKEDIDEYSKALFKCSKKSDKYHLKDCYYAKNVKPDNRRWTNDPQEAKYTGKELCSVCERKDQGHQKL
jgi:hypothetical protein